MVWKLPVKQVWITQVIIGLVFIQTETKTLKSWFQKGNKIFWCQHLIDANTKFMKTVATFLNQ